MLSLSTAATGLFQADHLGLPLPTIDPPERGETVLVWGGSTSVGSNGIQLARGAGYRVVTTASRRNFDYVRSLGAEAAVDYHDRDAVDQVIAAIGPGPLAGTLAIGNGSVLRTLTGPGPRPAARRGRPAGRVHPRPAALPPPPRRPRERDLGAAR
ncbi:zinc-binding dehydrogenase [Dactylosporangium sp. CA-092794]|uniref:zinc-binding dehydrogenase n=1 Tax=Dactylosporangium sp. CA-092794 TaxID=3239929 RepID=UPI003D89DA97